MVANAMQVRDRFEDREGITAGVRQIRRHTENIWLRTKRYNAAGKVVSGTGGICYLYFPARLSAVQRHALASVGVC
jgi:hypothetical protein